MLAHQSQMNMWWHRFAYSFNRISLGCFILCPKGKNPNFYLKPAFYNKCEQKNIHTFSTTHSDTHKQPKKKMPKKMSSTFTHGIIKLNCFCFIFTAHTQTICVTIRGYFHHSNENISYICLKCDSGKKRRK